MFEYLIEYQQHLKVYQERPYMLSLRLKEKLCIFFLLPLVALDLTLVNKNLIQSFKKSHTAI